MREGLVDYFLYKEKGTRERSIHNDWKKVSWGQGQNIVSLIHKESKGNKNLSNILLV